MKFNEPKKLKVLEIVKILPSEHMEMSMCPRPPPNILESWLHHMLLFILALAVSADETSPSQLFLKHRECPSNFKV